MFNKLLGYYHLDNAHGRAISQTFLAKHHAMDQTAYGAYQSLIGAGFNEPTQRSHNGAACIDQAGNFFNQYL